MAINPTPKEMPAGDGHPTAGNAINDSNFPTAQRPGKAFETLRAAFALRGHILHRTDPTDAQRLAAAALALGRLGALIDALDRDVRSLARAAAALLTAEGGASC